VAARLEALEWRNNPSIQIRAEKSLGDKRVEVMPRRLIIMVAQERKGLSPLLPLDPDKSQVC